MSSSWNTKWGTRRVRHDPPTLDEALTAASGFTADRDAQVEIAAGLMGVSLAEATAELRRLTRGRLQIATTIAPSRDKGGGRTVIVERKASRRLKPASGASAAAMRSH